MMIAACTTSIGRQRIEDANTGVVEWALQKGYDKPQVVYGNTDSVFVKFSRKDIDGNVIKDKKELLKHCIRCGIESGEYVNKKLKDPQNLEYEKTFLSHLCCISQKEIYW